MVYRIENNGQLKQGKSVQEDFDDIAFQCDLLALNASIEAARGGDTASNFARQATNFRNLSQDIIAEISALEAGEPDKLLQVMESRLDILAREQEKISALVAEIADNSRSTTHAMQFEDVVAQVVVYSKDRADSLRALTAQIEVQQRAIAAGIAANQNDIRSMTESFRQQLEALPADRNLPGEPNPAGPCRQ